MTSMALIETYIMSCHVLSLQLNLGKRDTFFGTTRGYCPSVYDAQKLDNWLDHWFKDSSPPSMDMPSLFGTTERIIECMEELAAV